MVWGAEFDWGLGGGGDLKRSNRMGICGMRVVGWRQVMLGVWDGRSFLAKHMWVSFRFILYGCQER